MFRLDKRKIFLLYQYYLVGVIENIKISEDEKTTKRLLWSEKCLEKENLLREKIAKKLKVGWEFSRLLPLEKALLVYASYEILFNQENHYAKMIIDQVINFSKVYLEENKHKYINKILDFFFKEISS